MSVAAVVASDVFRVMVAGVLVSAIIAGVAELARFSRWRCFFAAFLEIPVMVSMVTKMVIRKLYVCKQSR